MEKGVKPVNRARPRPLPLRSSGTTREERAIAELVTRLPDAVPDELQVARVWRRLQSPEPGPSQAWRWAAVSAMALTLIVGGGRLWLALSLSPSHAEALAIEGGVFTGGVGTSWAPLRRGDPIPSGALLRSDGSGQSLVRIPDVAALVLGPDADLGLDRLGRNTLLRLERGSVTARVAKRPRGSVFAVQASDFIVTVVGTVFSVTDGLDGQVAVSVNEGVVEVTGHGARWRVETGQRWSSNSPDERTPSDLPANLGALLNRALDVHASPELPALFRDLVHEQVALLSPHPPAPTVTAVPAPTVTPTPTHRPRPAGVVPSAAEGPHSPPAPNVTAPPDFYAEALDLERHGNHREAANVLAQAIAAGKGPRDLELYQLALLRQRHLGDPQGALDSLTAYRQQFPGGALRQEVSLSIVEAEVALGQEEAALAESGQFLSRYPANERADELRLLRGDLLRQHGAYAKADAEYRSVTGGEALDDALYYHAYCLRELGEGTRAIAALRDYLARFPAGRHAAPARQALGP
jgi:ferric-dicitrate binding protein FerR (iron transport regulator)/TolA-binding protein